MLKYCPHCNQRYTVGFGVTDFVHQCNSGNKALDQEDVVVVGSYENADGSTTKVNAQDVMRQGLVNELQGKRANIEEGKKKPAITRRGVKADTHRQKQHEEFININSGGLS